MMDKYIRVARVYPAVLGMLPTCILLALFMGEWFPQYQALVGNVKWVLYLIGGTALVSLAAGYLVSEIFKETAKWLFQYPMFKKDETEMPTTKMLLWKNAAISPEYHKEIAAKVKDSFGIKLPSQKEEQTDLGMAKMKIVDAVSQIRQNCRGDEILKQYNIEFGFCRNYLGASVWNILFIIGLSIANLFCGWLSWSILIVALVLQILLMIGCYYLLETRGWIYARYLFATFMGKK
jgi:hypothetical protein